MNDCWLLWLVDRLGINARIALSTWRKSSLLYNDWCSPWEDCVANKSKSRANDLWDSEQLSTSSVMSELCAHWRDSIFKYLNCRPHPFSGGREDKSLKQSHCKRSNLTTDQASDQQLTRNTQFIWGSYQICILHITCVSDENTNINNNMQKPDITALRLEQWTLSHLPCLVCWLVGSCCDIYLRVCLQVTDRAYYTTVS